MTSFDELKEFACSDFCDFLNLSRFRYQKKLTYFSLNPSGIFDLKYVPFGIYL